MIYYISWIIDTIIIILYYYYYIIILLFLFFHQLHVYSNFASSQLYGSKACTDICVQQTSAHGIGNFSI